MRNMLVGRRFQPIEKRCCNILGRLQKKEDEYLHLVSHDTMISRVQMSGLGLAAYRRLIFRSWKSYVEETKISKLRLDVGIQNFCNFLANLSEGEKKIVFPLIRETQQKIDDCRTRKKEIRCEKNWTFRRHLSQESALICRRKLFDDWIGVSDFTTGKIEEDFYSFLRRDFLEDDCRLKSLLEQRIRHLVKHAGFLGQQGGNFFSWIRHDNDGSACFASTLLDAVWKSCTYLQHDSHAEDHCGFGFFASSQFLKDTFRELGWVKGSEDMKNSGCQLDRLYACSLFCVLSLVWKCKVEF